MQQIVIDYKITFTSDHGKNVLDDLKEFCGYNKPSFTPGDPYHTAFNEGQRNVCLRILRVLAEKGLGKGDVEVKENL